MKTLPKIISALILLVILSQTALAAGHTMLKASNPNGIQMCNNNVVSNVTTLYTYNWDGYSVDGNVGSVTDVKGSWIVPKVKTTIPNQYSSNWVGMDGDISPTVEQLGTSSDTDAKGKPSYYAWYEFYPDYPKNIPLKINAGDKIFAEVNYNTKTSTFTLTLKDVTTGKSFSVTKKDKTYSRNSAEWVNEAPYSNGVLPLTNFGTTLFGKYYTSISSTCYATIDGKTKNIYDFSTDKKHPVNKLTMVSGDLSIKAYPSQLNKDGSSFSVNWLKAQ
jgi:hypothetical protein